MNFNRLQIKKWKQFRELDIEFHQNLTILTGANGSGKTTILNFLGQHFGRPASELATPTKDEKTGFISYLTRFFKGSKAVDDGSIGSLEYSGGTKGTITAPSSNQALYNLTIQPRVNVVGLMIPSYRPEFFYHQIPNITTKPRSKMDAYKMVLQSEVGKIQNPHAYNKPSNLIIKETLLNWALGGSGNEFIEGHSRSAQYFRGFQEILKSILPDSIGFNRMTIRNYEVVLETDSGDFMLDAVSGGVSSIIFLAWQIYTFSIDEHEHCTVLIDEIENHLHANMQRSILPDLMESFPKAQFIVSTHSPLVIGSVKDSIVYAFRYNGEHEVYNEKLDLVNKSKTATQILNEVLGVPFTMPIWVEETLAAIVQKYTLNPMDEASFDLMREELKVLGLEELMPLAIKESLKSVNDQDS